jgi:hypothetical protein
MSWRPSGRAVALSLAVQQLMLTELLEQGHCQQAGVGSSSCDGVEWRRRLANLDGSINELISA